MDLPYPQSGKVEKQALVGTEAEVESLRAQLRETEELWQQDVAKRKKLEMEVVELRASVLNTDCCGKEMELLSSRVRTVDTLLAYLKSKAKIMTIPRFAHASCGIKQQEGVGLVDKRGIPMAEWGGDASLLLLKASPSGAKTPEQGFVSVLDNDLEGQSDRQDGLFVERIAMAATQITEVMELLLKRAILAESKMDSEREKAIASQEEVWRKSQEIDTMWTRVEDMEKLATGTSCVLKQMQQKLESMENETSRQRQIATENEEELSRVRHDFGVLRSSMENLVKARETIRSMEKRIQEVETLSERLNTRVLCLEARKRQQDAEIRTLLGENDTLRGALDVKEAELAAIGDQVRILVNRPEQSNSSHLLDHSMQY